LRRQISVSPHFRMLKRPVSSALCRVDHSLPGHMRWINRILGAETESERIRSFVSLSEYRSRSSSFKDRVSRSSRFPVALRLVSRMPIPHHFLPLIVYRADRRNRDRSPSAVQSFDKAYQGSASIRSNERRDLVYAKEASPKRERGLPPSSTLCSTERSAVPFVSLFWKPIRSVTAPDLVAQAQPQC